MNIDHLLTPYKLNKPAIEGSGIKGTFNSHAVDCPTPFFHKGKWHLMFVGFDGRGYQTAVSDSDDLVHWSEPMLILKRGSHMKWDNVGMAGCTILMSNDLYAGNRLRKIDGKYWLMYHSYPDYGYESGPAQIGLCWTEDEKLLDWNFYGEPVYTPLEGAPWENGGLYKSWLIEHNGTFYMFYNAKNNNPKGWNEQIGVATSKDMIKWERYDKNPVIRNDKASWDSDFCADPMVFWDSREEQWVMFYYGLGPLSACDGIAVSKDLFSWKKFPIPVLTTGRDSEAIDSIYAHKPGICVKDGVLYHFYCACRPSKPDDKTAGLTGEHRCISVARSIPW